jgi:hypothetical protein
VSSKRTIEGRHEVNHSSQVRSAKGRDVLQLSSTRIIRHTINTCRCHTMKIMGLLVLRLGMSGAIPLFRPSYSMCTWVPSPWVKLLGRETVCLPPSSAKVRNEWSYTSVPPRGFLICVGIISHLRLLLCTRGRNERTLPYMILRKRQFKLRLW